MLIKEFVQAVRKSLSTWSVTHYKFADIFVELESRRTIDRLNKMLDSYLSAGMGDSEATNESLIEFIDFLVTRWEKIQSTDASYPHNPNSPANVACRVLATEINLALHDKVSVAKLLMPTLEITHIESGDNQQIEIDEVLHRIVLTDDNHFPIDIIKCISELKNSAILKMTCEIDGVRRELTHTEVDRVKSHSLAAAEYYTVMANYETRSKDALLDAAKRFKSKLRESEKFEVTATYGKKGVEKLRDRLHFSAFIARDNLLQTVKEYPLEHRQQFLNSIELKKLKLLLLNTQTFEAVLADHTLFQGDEDHARTVMLALFTLYQRIITEREAEYASISGRFFGYHKEQKIKAVAVPIRFLLSDKSLDEFSTEIGASENAEHHGALGNGLLGKLVKHTKCIKDPTAREINTNSERQSFLFW